MIRQVLVAALALAAAGASAAADRPEGRLFITPMGEPFRSTDPAVPPIQVWLNEKDTDHDGKLSQAEYLADATAFFARIDANHDGVLTSLESNYFWETYEPEILTEWSNNSGFEGVRRSNDGDNQDQTDASRDQARHQREMDQRLRGAALYGLINVLEPIMSCDVNFDRRVTQDEYMACATQRFAQIDTNHDGFFALSEAPARLTAPR